MHDQAVLIVYLTGVGVSFAVGASQYSYAKRVGNKIDGEAQAVVTVMLGALWPIMAIYLFSKHVLGLPGTILARRALKAKARQHILDTPIQDLIEEAAKD